MTDRIMDGKALADKILVECAKRIGEAMPEIGRAPVLKIVTVGDDDASRVYVKNKRKACERVGIVCDHITMNADTSAANMYATINGDNENVDGVILQLPVPSRLEFVADCMFDNMLMRKDVDGLGMQNEGWWYYGCGQSPCTALGIMRLLKEYDIDPRGKNVCIIGRSKLVGRPLAAMMTKADATVTLCHSYTRNLETFTRMADIVVVAVGKPGFFTSDMLRPGATLVDVGINRDADGKLCGDCTADAYAKAGMYTPVPGGVGPMTVAMLIENTVKSYERSMYDD